MLVPTIYNYVDRREQDSQNLETTARRATASNSPWAVISGAGPKPGENTANSAGS